MMKEKFELAESVVMEQLRATGALNDLMAQIDAGTLQISGEGGFLKELIKAVLERGLQVELSDHVGYEQRDPEAGFYPHSRNGFSAKTVSSEVGDVGLEIFKGSGWHIHPKLGA
jgi:putative transposase